MQNLLQPIVNLLTAAREGGLKYPKVRLAATAPDDPEASYPVVLSLAGDGARIPGAVNVTNGARYGCPSARWYGRILPDGVWSPGRAEHPEAALVLRYLIEVSDDPARAIGEDGVRAARCSFCGRPLTDPRSTAAGYGETCAERWGLPWGATPAPIEDDEDEGEGGPPPSGGSWTASYGSVPVADLGPDGRGPITPPTRATLYGQDVRPPSARPSGAPVRAAQGTLYVGEHDTRGQTYLPGLA